MKNAAIALVKIFIATIILGISQKIVFLITYFSQSSELGAKNILGVFWHGLSLDISVAGYVTALPLLFVLLGSWGGWKIGDHIWKRSLLIYLVLLSLAMSCVVGVDLNLYGYWDYRVDATLIPYLASPKEAAASVTFIDLVRGFTGFFINLFLAIYLYRWAIRDFKIRRLTIAWSAVSTVIYLLLGGVLFLCIRGGVEVAVANVSKVYFSANQFANHAAVNPSFSLLSSLGKLERFDEMYRYLDNSRAEELLTQMRGSKSAPRGTIEGNPNVLVVICESFTRLIMDSDIDGRPVMPNLRRIAAEGLLFENGYATAGRTDRGVASVLSAFPSQPKISIMKIPAKSRNLPSIASSLKREGYSTHFYYGGDLNFMDMASYLYATGWESLTWMKDIKSDEPTNKWGYNDGVMAQYVADAVAELSKSDEQPFLASWLTISSHEPFDVPEQFGFENKMINSMAYTDTKIALLVDELKRSGAWENLLVVFVADHGNGYMADYNSPQRFRIPIIWSGGALNRHGVEEAFTSQIDIVPTLLSELGVRNDEFIFGRDVLDRESQDEPLIYYTFNDGAAVVDSLGAVIIDNTSLRTAIASPHDDKNSDTKESDLTPRQAEQLEKAKALLQMTHQKIEEM